MVDKLENPARDRLQAGELALGVGIRQVRSVDIAVMMKTCGYDWLFLDLEHGSLTRDNAAQIAMTALAVGITPIARVPIGGYGLAAALLDSGMLGIVFPHVETADEARRIVHELCFPPLGARGVAGLIPQFGYAPVRLAEAVGELNRATLVTVMVETPEAIARADEIAAVEGIDVVMIGTNDLAMAMGRPGEFGHDDVAAAYASVAQACARHGKWVGSGGVNDLALLRRYIDTGARFVLAGSDAGFMIAAAKERSAAIRAK